MHFVLVFLEGQVVLEVLEQYVQSLWQDPVEDRGLHVDNRQKSAESRNHDHKV